MALSKTVRLCLESNVFFAEDILNSREGVPPINYKRRTIGEFKCLYNEYRCYPEKFFEYTRTTVDTFDYILLYIEEDIKVHSKCKRAITPAEILFLTLRYLGHGQSFRSLAQSYRLGGSTVAKSIYQTLNAIWKKMVQIRMPQPTQEHLKHIANELYLKWQYPNCIGSIDGKHFCIINPPHSGSEYFNYKKYFSLVLQGISDADYKFIAIEVGGKGRQSDGGTFHFSRLNALLSQNGFNVPPAQNLPGSNINLPHVLIGDEAYPLKPFLMRPYPSYHLNSGNRAFNKRLSRARTTIECGFGILTSKFRIFLKSIDTNIEHAKLTIKVSCLLHNIIRERDGERDRHVRDFWEHYRNSQAIRQPRSRSRRNNRASVQANFIREQFKNYLVNNPLSN